jgi:hypothetical protein
MPRRISSSDSDDPDYEEEQSSEEESEAERENLRKKIWQHFNAGDSREETFIELCRELHEEEIDLDKASEYFWNIDEDINNRVDGTLGKFLKNN